MSGRGRIQNPESVNFLRNAAQTGGMGIIEEVVRRIIKVIFYRYLAENLRFLNHYYLKAGTPLIPEKGQTFTCQDA
ncbi:MAG: hypothetical protein F6K54_03320 [Okeania sp. SIO3B5]|uniref:hypothetical protein n=1 Tax=Okeania sp. SIO3B5 TaxID=2607811 RepID=UPI0014013A34|nr:hypothetical protein [Okeania sp. SIO3B5]NEO52195.1 hypothetical protein [Okeania sp. SIO3B5]